jgi:hypothetical protein
MSRRPSLQARVDDYLAERRRQGFHLRSRDAFLSGFARSWRPRVIGVR